jgi:hypothetical protein
VEHVRLHLQLKLVFLQVKVWIQLQEILLLLVVVHRMVVMLTDHLTRLQITMQLEAVVVEPVAVINMDGQ